MEEVNWSNRLDVEGTSDLDDKEIEQSEEKLQDLEKSEWGLKLSNG